MSLSLSFVGEKGKGNEMIGEAETSFCSYVDDA